MSNKYGCWFYYNRSHPTNTYLDTSHQDLQQDITELRKISTQIMKTLASILLTSTSVNEVYLCPRSEDCAGCREEICNVIYSEHWKVNFPFIQCLCSFNIFCCIQKHKYIIRFLIYIHAFQGTQPDCVNGIYSQLNLQMHCTKMFLHCVGAKLGMSGTCGEKGKWEVVAKVMVKSSSTVSVLIFQHRPLFWQKDSVVTM